MIGRFAGGVLLGLLAATAAQGQAPPTVAVSSGVEPRPWFGLDTRLDRPAWVAGASFVGGPDWGQFREATVRAGLARERGPFRWSIGGIGLGSTLGGTGGGVFGGGRFRMGRFEVTGEVGQVATVSGSWQLGATAASADSGRKGSARRVGHGVLGGQWRLGGIELHGRLIRRSRLAPDDRTGWDLGVGVVPFPQLRVELTAGRAPIGPSLYLPFRNHLTIGASWAERRPARKPDVAPAAGALSAFEVSRRRGGTVAIVVRVAGARQIDLIADFTDWTPLSLGSRGGGVFAVEVPLAEGVYLVNLRIDGGPPSVPAGLEGVDDGFGGRVGVLVVR